MKVVVTDLEGEATPYSNVDEVAFSNEGTFGWPSAFDRDASQKKVIVNAQGYSSMVLSND